MIVEVASVVWDPFPVRKEPLDKNGPKFRELRHNVLKYYVFEHSLAKNHIRDTCMAEQNYCLASKNRNFSL